MNSKNRLMFLVAIFLGLFSVVVYRAFQLQLLTHGRVESLARRQLQRKLEIVGRRGSIVDRNGRELAVSTNSLSVFANPTLVQHPTRVARKLARALGMSEKNLVAKLRDAPERKFVWIARQLRSWQMKRIQKIDLKQMPGVGVLPEYRREYPNGSLAAQVLGFVSVDGKGLEGVEKKFDGQLKGARSVVMLRKDALGRPLLSQTDQIRLNSDEGAQIHLTIDADLQYSAEQALVETVKSHDAEAGTLIVMNPGTGEILALANYPTFDPNAVGESNAAARRNRALTDPIEPGSVVKPFVVARALEDNVVTPTTKVSGGHGFIRIGKKIIGEAEAKHRFDKVSIVDLIRFSSNVGTVSLEQKMGFARVEDTFAKIGFGSLTGVDLGSESRGLVPKLKNSQLLEQATMSFGQGIGVTALQMASAYSVLANGGYKVIPRLVIDDARAPVVRPRIFSEATVKEMHDILEKVVEGEGTGVLAKVGGFKVAGKTGTSQRVDYAKGGYEKGAYWSSFAGFIPSDRPRYVIYAMIDRPQKNGFYGAAVVAPLFARVAQAAIRFGDASPSRKMADAKVLPVRSGKIAVASPVVEARADGVPDLTNLPLARAFRLLKGANLKTSLIGQGDHVDAQTPAPGTALSPDRVVYLKLR